MKLTSLTKSCAILAVSAGLAFTTALAADTVVTETTTNGTISSFAPETFIIKSETAPGPLTYSYSKTTRYVDEAGNVVARETIRPGVPVSVHYVREGDRMIADRVTVRKDTTTTTTTTEPGRAPTPREAKALREAAEHPEREARRAAEKGKPFPPVDPTESKTTTTTTKERAIEK